MGGDGKGVPLFVEVEGGGEAGAVAMVVVGIVCVLCLSREREERCEEERGVK